MEITSREITKSYTHDGAEIFSASISLPVTNIRSIDRFYEMTERFLLRRAETMFKNARHMYNFFKRNDFAFKPHRLEYRFAAYDEGALRIDGERCEYGGTETYIIRTADTFFTDTGYIARPICPCSLCQS
ncbi:hypothetical protein FACS1894217_06060 [Clostridia bacterium]|nr:hypothetical protein FACS1894217_06060 [Clostridia bacterium]